MTPYYQNKEQILGDLFGCEVAVEDDGVRVGPRLFPIVDDVLILMEPERCPPSVRRRLDLSESVDADGRGPFSNDVQSSFGAEWQEFPEILPEHKREFEQYFDIVDPSLYRGRRVCDLGAGIGRWSYFLRHEASEIVLVDFSEAIFEARKNLKDVDNAVFVLGDVTSLPFRQHFADFAFCLGVLHHLPIPALEGVRLVSRHARTILIYLYSALDGRPAYYRALFRPVNGARSILSQVKSRRGRQALCWLMTILIYLPAIAVFQALSAARVISPPPFLAFYRNKSIKRLRQDAYDRFFTSIEQRVTREEIRILADTFDEVTISSGLPYWHFLCRTFRSGPFPTT